MKATALAVDLGATSGRVIAGTFDDGRLVLDEVNRFANEPRRTSTGMSWNITGLYEHVCAGIGEALNRYDEVVSVAIDSWAVDYGLLSDGHLISEPRHYRDARHRDGVGRVESVIARDDTYARNGLQFQPFNTLYQLAVDQAAGGLERADTCLMIPDLIAYWLTGNQVAERTNASTTGLLDPRTRAWDVGLMLQLGYPTTLFPTLVDPGTTTGFVSPGAHPDLGLGAPLRVVAVGSHDTASAVAGIPMTSESAAYISCGTWGLVGIERAEPLISDAGRAENFTNELGVDGGVRFQRNVTGLWLLSEATRTWSATDGVDVNLTRLLHETSLLAPGPTFDCNDPRLSAPEDMVATIIEVLVADGHRPPASRTEVVRAIIDSLAGEFARSVRLAAELDGRTVDVVHMVGGGSLNGLLCQATADALELPVFAGPAEATAVGNLLVQARAAGIVAGTALDARRVVEQNFSPIRFDPSRRGSS